MTRSAQVSVVVVGVAHVTNLSSWPWPCPAQCLGKRNDRTFKYHHCLFHRLDLQGNAIPMNLFPYSRSAHARLPSGVAEARIKRVSARCWPFVKLLRCRNIPGKNKARFLFLLCDTDKERKSTHSLHGNHSPTGQRWDRANSFVHARGLRVCWLRFRTTIAS